VEAEEGSVVTAKDEEGPLALLEDRGRAAGTAPVLEDGDKMSASMERGMLPRLARPIVCPRALAAAMRALAPDMPPEAPLSGAPVMLRRGLGVE
jgi:hypothetical protein